MNSVTIVGIFYALFIGFFLWMGNGLLIAYLRSEAVRVDDRQLPDLNATFREVCQLRGLVRPPALYVIQAGGLLNAFATRFSGRDFVVGYSDLVPRCFQWVGLVSGSSDTRAIVS